MFDKNILAKNIKKYRKLKNISQNELAQFLFISPQAISKWESGVNTPDVENLCNIAAFFEISTDALLNDTPLQKVMICVDGGGSKTEFLLFTDDGNIIDRLVLGGSNPNIIGINESFSVFKKGIDLLIKSKYQLVGIYIGAAGMSSGNSGEIIMKMLKQEYGNIPKSVKSDIYSVIASSMAEENCIALICGTGSVVYASTFNGLVRFGGWGTKLDTLGGGYDIGRAALCTALSEREALKEVGALTTLVEQKLKTRVWESIHDIYEKGDSYIASFAPVVFEAYSMGDKIAEDILTKNACRLVELISKADSLYDCGKTVVASGSIITKNKIFSDMLKKHLPPDKKLIVPSMPQIYGAGRLCLKLCSKDDKGFTDNFTRQYGKYVNEV